MDSKAIFQTLERGAAQIHRFDPVATILGKAPLIKLVPFFIVAHVPLRHSEGLRRANRASGNKIIRLFKAGFRARRRTQVLDYDLIGDFFITKIAVGSFNWNRSD